MCCISEALAWAFYALKQASDKGSLNPFVEGLSRRECTAAYAGRRRPSYDRADIVKRCME